MYILSVWIFHEVSSSQNKQIDHNVVVSHKILGEKPQNKVTSDTELNYKIPNIAQLTFKLKLFIIKFDTFVKFIKGLLIIYWYDFWIYLINIYERKELLGFGH